MGLQVILISTWIVELTCQAGQHDSSGLSTFRPATIFATTRTAREGESLHLKCSIVGITAPKDVIVYLCKDGVGMRMRQLGDSEDFIFILLNVTQQDSGSYSCVYSDSKVKPDEVQATGKNPIFIQILPLSGNHTGQYDSSGLPTVSPATIFATATTAREGESLDLKCSIVGITRPKDVIVYLCKDGIGMHMRHLSDSEDFLFTLPDVTQQDSGSYSCVYTDKRVKPGEISATGKNSISIQILPLSGKHTGQHDSSDLPTVSPATIFATATTAREGESLDLKCSIVGITPPKDAIVYLCKDGIGMHMRHLSDSEDFLFTLPDVTQQDSGSYSCVYADRRVKPGEISATGKNSISIQILPLSGKHTGQHDSSDLPTFNPATIFATTSEVREGESLHLKCSVVGITAPKDVIVYLCKDGIGMRMRQLGDSEDFLFTLPNVTQQDSGSYSCVYSDRKVKSDEVQGTGKNPIFIQILSLSEFYTKAIQEIFQMNVIRLLLSAGVLIIAAFIITLSCTHERKERRGRS